MNFTGLVPVGIALGSNEGDRLANLQAARARILMLPQRNSDAGLACLSAPVFETDPVECTSGAGPFLNTVVEIACDASLSPLDLLSELRGIENALGRPTRHPRNAPRTIDLDILYVGNVHSCSAELTIPHPRIAQRRFVLAPLTAIRPGLVLPGETLPASAMLAVLGSQQNVTLHASHW